MDSFRLAMADAGVRYVGPLEADGKFRRVHVEGDRKGTRNGWYVLHGDGVPAGAFGTNKGDLRLTWKATAGVRPLTREERREIAEAAARKKATREAVEAALQAEAAVRANAMWDAGVEAVAHPYLTRKGVAAHGLRVGVWLKESPPDPDTGEIRTTRINGALLVPIRDERKNIVSLQAIFPSKVGERDKDFVYGGRKRGCWFTIGQPTKVDGALTIVICEGYATGASIHRATGLGVVVAFDAGNLGPVAETARRLMPGARIVIAGDNDAWTLRPDKVTPWNPGAEKAEAAAAAVDGVWVLPTFSKLDGKPTDFNDLATLEGEREVARQIMAALRAPAEPDVEPEQHTQTEADHYQDIQDVGPDFEPDDAPVEEAAATVEEKPAKRRKKERAAAFVAAHKVDFSPYFTVRGHDLESIYIYQHQAQMIYQRGFSDWPEAALTWLAPLDLWETAYPSDSGMVRKMAIGDLQKEAKLKGVFDPSKCRGRGAWIDAGRIVYHCGDHLIVDGVAMPIAAIKTSYIYEQGYKLSPPADEPMSAADGKKLFEIAQKFNWTRPASAVLLAGWCALAPLGGALRWRPHIWITGGAGSGKSTILNEYVWFLMGGTEVYAQGNSTEAGIRQTLRADASPVLFDESEQNTERDEQRMQNVLALVRQASTESGARTLKGSASGIAMGFLVRSMFCLASIQVGMKQQADLERMTVLALRPKKKSDLDGAKAAETWRALSGALAEMRRDQELPARLLKRALDLLPTTLQNIEIFAQAAAEKFGSQRDGDQFGAMLAGAWSLVSTKLATLDEARAMIDRYDWSEYTEDTETEESSKALGALLGAKLRVKNGIEVSVCEVVAAAAGKPMDGYNPDQKEADAILRRHGMAIQWKDRHPENAGLLVANGSMELRRLLEGTPYAADIKGQLSRVPGAFKEDPKWFNGVKMRSVGIPLVEILETLAGQSAAFPVDDDIVF